MGILQFPTQLAGTPGIRPNFRYMVTTDSLGTLTTPGYLNQPALEVAPLNVGDIIQCLYSVNQATGNGTYGIFTIAINGATGIITLSAWGGAGDVITPTIANHIATFTNTSGTISEDPATAISGGNIQAGLSGTAGKLASFPATAAKGSLAIAAVANTGNTVTTISNVAMGEASVISIPDPGNAVARFLVGATATPFVSGNFPQNSGTGGLMVDSGIAVSSLLTSANAVLLTPSGNQTITAHNLILSGSGATVQAPSFTPSSTSGIIGTTTNNNAAAGSVGEYVTAIVASSDAVSLTSATAADVTSISLTAGDWDVWGNAGFNGAASTVVMYLYVWTSLTSATISGDAGAYNGGVYVGGATVGTVGTVGIEAPFLRVSVAGTTTVYLSVQGSFSVSTVGAFGRIFARRVR